MRSLEHTHKRCPLSFFHARIDQKGGDFFFSIYTNTHKSIDIPQRITSLADRFDSSVYLFKKKV